MAVSSGSDGEHSAAYAGLSARVSGLEGGLSEIKNTLGGIVNRLDSNTRTPWGTIISAMAVLGGALVGYITIRIEPIVHDTDRLTAIIEKMNDRFMPSSEINAKVDGVDKSVDKRLDTIAARRDDWQRQSEQRSRDNRDEIVKVREGIVTRSEHEQHWAGDRLAREAQQREIDDVKKTVASLYSARDLMRDDHDAIRNLELQFRGVPKASAP